MSKRLDCFKLLKPQEFQKTADECIQFYVPQYPKASSCILWNPLSKKKKETLKLPEIWIILYSYRLAF